MCGSAHAFQYTTDSTSTLKISINNILWLFNKISIRSSSFSNTFFYLFSGSSFFHMFYLFFLSFKKRFIQVICHQERSDFICLFNSKKKKPQPECIFVRWYWEWKTGNHFQWKNVNLFVDTYNSFKFVVYLNFLFGFVNRIVIDANDIFVVFLRKKMRWN